MPPRHADGSSSRERFAGAFEGLTARRARVLAAFGLVGSVFSASVAVSYARGLPASHVVIAFAQTYVSGALWFGCGLLAGLVAFHRVPGPPWFRAVAAGFIIAAVVWLVLPLALALKFLPLRDVYQ